MKIICVGRNYVKHIEELNNVVLKEPAIFLKPETALLPEGEDFQIPSFSDNIHHEVEIVLRIGKRGKDISAEDAKNYIEDIGLGIDFTARDIQERLKEKKLSWELSKAFDGAAVVGNFIPARQISDFGAISFRLDKNAKSVQQGNSGHMIFSFESIISFVSKFFTLEKGDLIFTGTPEGVGKVVAGDILSGFIFGNQMFEITVK